VDLLRGGLVVFEGDYYPLAHLPKHDASDRCPVRTSENAVKAKFALSHSLDPMGSGRSREENSGPS
jgi:hypothetical protein